MIKTKVAFWRAGFYPARFSKSSDWLKKAGPPKKPLLLWSCKQANYVLVIIARVHQAFGVEKINILHFICHRLRKLYSKVSIFSFCPPHLFYADAAPGINCISKVKKRYLNWALRDTKYARSTMTMIYWKSTHCSNHFLFFFNFFY